MAGGGRGQVRLPNPTIGGFWVSLCVCWTEIGYGVNRLRGGMEVPESGVVYRRSRVAIIVVYF